MRRAALALTLVLLVAVVAASGCGSRNPVKERQKLRREANAICAHFERLQNDVRFPSVNPLAARTTHMDRARWAVALKQIVELGWAEVRSLQRLETPEELRDRFQKLVSAKKAAYDDLATGADAAKRNHPALIKRPVNAGRAKLARASVLAKALGVRQCA
jgi:hypothetical protein